MKIENNKIDNLLWRALSNTEKPSDLLIQKVKRDMAYQCKSTVSLKNFNKRNSKDRR